MIWDRFNFRGKARLMHRFVSHSGIRRRNLFGYRVTLDCSDYIQRSIYIGCYEWHETKTLRRYLKPGMTIVDAGANVGYYALLAASLGCKVHAFEPSPTIYKQLENTVTTNGIDDIKAVEAGLSDENTTAQLAEPREDIHTPSLLDHTAADYSTVELRCLDDYLDEQKIEFVDLLKMDVEGFEPNVIRGAARALKDRRIKAILCELNDYWLRCNASSPSQFFDEICNLGFEPTEKLGSPGEQTILFTLGQ